MRKMKAAVEVGVGVERGSVYGGGVVCICYETYGFGTNRRRWRHQLGRILEAEP